MASRFVTDERQDEIEAEITAYSSAITAYHAIFETVVNEIAAYIEALFPTSGIETRLISSEGRDNEQWRGHLLAASPKATPKIVDVFCLSIGMSEMMRQGEGSGEVGSGVNSFDKPFSLVIDYFYDYDFGTDEVNSEKTFNERIDTLEFVLEQIRTCLPNQVEIESGIFRRMIQRFTNASTHIAKGDFALKISEL